MAVEERFFDTREAMIDAVFEYTVSALRDAVAPTRYGQLSGVRRQFACTHLQTLVGGGSGLGQGSGGAG